MGYTNIISGKEFCKRNSSLVGRDEFYEEYYRILHTSYLRAKDEQCIEIIKREFLYTFGAVPDKDSISYIYSTAKYFVYDAVISSLLDTGKVDSRYFYWKLIIEIGFDVWLIKSFEHHDNIDVHNFKNWLPVDSSYKNEKSINEFLTFKLPKSNDFERLYNSLKPYKNEIIKCYKNLIIANAANPDQYSDFINSLEELPVDLDLDAEEALNEFDIVNDLNPHVSDISDFNILQESGDDLDDVNDIPADLFKFTDNECEDELAAFKECLSEDEYKEYNEYKHILDDALDKASEADDLSNDNPNKNSKVDNNNDNIPADKPKIKVEINIPNIKVAVKPSVEKPAKNDSIFSTGKKPFKQKKNSSCFFTKEKVETAAKCLVVAGILLVPLICYNCIKKK